MRIGIFVAVALIVIGVLLLCGAGVQCGWDFSAMGKGNYETNVHTVTEEFHNFSIDTDTADILFAPSEDGTCRVECYEDEKARHSVSVQGDTLAIDIEDERAWYEYIGFDFATPKVTIYLPETEYGTLSVREDTGAIKVPKGFVFESVDLSTDTGSIDFFASALGDVNAETHTGSITVEHISVRNLDLSVSTGRITVSNTNCQGDIRLNVSTGKNKLIDVHCENFTSMGDTGSISLNHVVATGRFYIERSTGDVLLDGCDAGEIFIATDTGDVEGTLLSEKIFFTETDTGRVDVPKSMSGGKCEIYTDTGDIQIKVRPS